MLGNDVYNEISLCIRYSSPVSIYLLGGGAFGIRLLA